MSRQRNKESSPSSAGAVVNRALWGGQVPFYHDATFVDPEMSRVPMGLIDDKESPSHVYSFGYTGAARAFQHLVGHYGVTAHSPVIDNLTRKSLGTIADYLPSQQELSA